MYYIGFRLGLRRLRLAEAQAQGFGSRLRLRLGVFEPMDNIIHDIFKNFV
jgi:hypothetical protein